MKIGVFDSGIGGEAVAERLRQLLPQAVIITANDHQNVPYGRKPADVVYRLTKQAIRPLFDAGCHAIVLACNTATAAAISQLRADYPAMPFIGLEPMVKPAALATKNRVIAVCATLATLSGSRYQVLRDTWATGITVIEPDCADWAEKIEQGRAADIELSALKDIVLTNKVDVIVLACTHYHWIKDAIAQQVGAGVIIMEPSDAIAAQTQRILQAASEPVHR
ncbi:aspartate/glutamate racemase family protein [Chromatiaceae bacterium AAb-1]|nr:aspartate/glutamate racemase family protein [Chromatiaceae bacterium AAb-1]